MVCLLLLTLDRYKRIHLILPGTKMYYVFKSAVFGYCALLVVLALTYTFELLPHVNQFEGVRMRYDSAFSKILFAARPLIQLLGLVSGMSMYYNFTIKLVLTCIRGVEWDKVKKVLLEKWAIHPRPSVLSPSFSSKSESVSQPSIHQDLDSISSEIDLHRAQKPVALIQSQNVFVAIKIVSYLIIVIVIDLIMFTAIILTNTDGFAIDDAIFNDVMLFVGSWTVFHVLIIYELLDMFLRELKKVKFVKRVEEAKKAPDTLKSEPLKWDTTNDTDNPDPVDMELNTEYKTTRPLSDLKASSHGFKRWFTNGKKKHQTRQSDPNQEREIASVSFAFTDHKTSMNLINYDLRVKQMMGHIDSQDDRIPLIRC